MEKKPKKSVRNVEIREFDALPLKKRNFVIAYVANGMNASAAAREAGYKNAGHLACRLLKEPEILHHIKEKTSRHVIKQDINTDSLLEELKAIAYSDWSDFGEVEVVEKNGHYTARINYNDWKNVPASAKRAVKSVKMTGDSRLGNQTVEITLYDKDKALEKLMKYAGMYTNREMVQHLDLPELVDLESAKRYISEVARLLSNGVIASEKANTLVNIAKQYMMSCEYKDMSDALEDLEYQVLEEESLMKLGNGSCENE